MRRIILSLFLIVLISPTRGQEGGTFDFTTYKPEIDIVRIQSDEAPVIDADLSDPIWSKATKIDRFYQIEPVAGAAPSEETIVYVAYDENNLYFAFYCYMKEPGGLRAGIMQRDKDLWKDSNVRIHLDPYDSDRDGMSFIINALGTQHDRLVENNTRNVDEWDTIWDVEAKIVEDGWVAEVAIPFRSISYDPNNSSWGFDITRDIREKNERVRWSQINQSLDLKNYSYIGNLNGINNTNQGKGLDVQGFAKLGFSRDRSQTPRDDDIEIEPSGNIYYKITPALTGTLTFNTDFSDTPLDQRQVNTGRFGLFFPETRDFMLQDKAVFEFGGNALQPPGFGGSPNGLPFFSRRIGIVGNQIADISLGGKVSGRVGDYNLGALTTLMTEETNLDSQVLSVARISKDVLNESRLGAILTHGDPSGVDTNTVYGVDFQYQDSEFIFGGGRFVADFFYQRSMSDELLSAGRGKDDDSFGMYIGYPNDLTRWFISAKEIGENFAPALGFVNRRNIRDYSTEYFIRRRPQNSPIRWWEIGPALEVTTNLDNTVESQKIDIQGMFQTQIGDELRISFGNLRERITNPFLIAGRLPVLRDDYYFNQVEAQVATSNTRMFRFDGKIICCEIYDGDYLALNTDLELRPSKHFRVTFSYDREYFDLPTGDLTVHVGAIEASVNFTPDMQIDTQMQYDNISEQFSYVSRFRWFPKPETEVFVSLGHSASIEVEDFPRHFVSAQTALTIRFGHTFRF